MSLTPALVHSTIDRLTAPGGPFEVTERDIDGDRVRAFTHGAPTLASVIAAGRGHAGSDFIVFEDQRWSFDRFFAEVDALAAALQHDYGIRPGDRVAIAMRNCPDWLLVFAAAALIGAVVVPINSWGSADELQYALRDSGAVLIAGDLPRILLAADVLTHEGIRALFSEVDGSRADLPHDVAVLVRTVAEAASTNRNRTYTLADPASADPALLMYTSGSTGQPKGVIYRHVAVGQALMHMMLVGFLAIEFGGPVALRGGAGVEAALVTVPLFHATGLFSGFLMPCLVGQKVALLRRWDPETAMRVIAAEKITMLSTVPAILKDMLTHPRLRDHDLSSISRVAAAGAATPADLPELLQDRLGILSRSAGYGMTETASVGATMSGPVFDLKPLSCGIPSPIIEMRSAGPSGAALPPGQDGEIQMRGVTVTPGYWQLGAQTPGAFTADGWLRTGDIGHLDEDGFVHITGRIKEIIIRGGENIAPIEIENVAYRHTGVQEAAVFGVPDDIMGEELAIVCHPRPGATLTEDDLRDHLGRVLPSFKVPRFIRISDNPLPRNASEKIHRLALRNDFMAPGS
jgi:long-chain acyl-CoA synthetase